MDLLLSRIDEMNGKLAKIESQNEELKKNYEDNKYAINSVTKLVTSRFNELNTSLQSQHKPIATNPKQLKTLASNDERLDQLNNRLAKVEQLITSKDSSQQLDQLNKTLDFLVKGESEANSVIDSLVPTLTRIETSLQSLGKKVSTDYRDISDDIMTCCNKVSDTKGYTKDVLRIVEEMKSKLKHRNLSEEEKSPKKKNNNLLDYSDLKKDLNRFSESLHSIQNEQHQMKALLGDRIVHALKLEIDSSLKKSDNSEKISQLHRAMLELEDKIDSWFKFSKKVASKSDESAEKVFLKLDLIHKYMLHVTEEGLKEHLEIKDLFEQVFKTSKNVHTDISNRVDTLDLTCTSKICPILNDIQDRVGLCPLDNHQSQSLQTDTHTLQVLNSLAEVKNTIEDHDKKNTRSLHEVRSKINEVLKNEKLIPRVLSSVEQVHKDIVSDAKTLSQMNSLLQGVRTSTSSHENKYSTLIKQLADIKQNMVESKNLLDKIEDAQDDQVKDFKGFITTKFKGVLDLSSKKGNSFKNEELARNVLNMEKNLLSSIQNLNQIMSRDRGIPIKGSMDSPEAERVEIRDAKLTKIGEELHKHNGISSEILNSVEDLKQLISSTPNVIHNLPPLIERVEKTLTEIPNEMMSLHAALEENMCKNLETKVKEIHKSTLGDIAKSFDTMEQRLVVIRKYAKYGNSGGIQSGTSSPARNSPATNFGQNGANLIDDMVKEEPKLALDKNLNINLEFKKFQNEILSVIQQSFQVQKQLFDDQASAMEGQFDRLTLHIKGPIAEIKRFQQKLVKILQTDVRNFLQHSESFQDLIKKQKQPQNVKVSHLNKLEKQLSASIRECSSLLSEIKSSSQRTEVNIRGIFNGEMRKMIEEMSNDYKSPKEVETIRALVESLTKIQHSQIDIQRLLESNAQCQMSTNEILKEMLGSLEDLKVIVAQKKKDGLDTRKEEKIFARVVEKIAALENLETKLSTPKTQVQDLNRLIKSSVKALENLLQKEPSPPSKDVTTTANFGEPTDIIKEMNTDDNSAESKLSSVTSLDSKRPLKRPFPGASPRKTNFGPKRFRINYQGHLDIIPEMKDLRIIVTKSDMDKAKAYLKLKRNEIPTVNPSDPVMPRIAVAKPPVELPNTMDMEKKSKETV